MSAGPKAKELSTVRRDAVSASLVRAQAFTLRVVDGPDAGTFLVVNASRPSRSFVGSSPTCDLRLNDRMVSRRHLSLEASDAGLRVVDLGSTNGTTAAGMTIVEAVFHGGEVFRVGDTSVRVEPLGPAAEPELSDAMRFGRMFGGSVEMRRLYPLCARLAAANVPVIVEGETGTGKEVLAEALHEASARAQAPMVVFDCTAVPPTLMDTALFGHEKGSFTGATSMRRGVFEQAHGGTLFIDEIGELDLALQPKLLRAIERGEVQRVGSETWQRVDVRIIAATRRDIDREIQEGRFRDDLFFRLAVGRIELPPLRRRTGDIALLTRHFWRELGGDAAGPPDELFARYESYGWPGNVRELHNTIARRIALGEMATVGALKTAAPAAAAAMANPIDEVLALDLPLAHARAKIVEALESRYVERILAHYDGSVARAAAASGIKRRYFQVLKARYSK